MKNRTVLIGVIIAILVVLSGGYLLVLGKKSASPSPVSQSGSPEEQVLTLKPEEIGLKLAVRSDNKAVKFTISNPTGISSIEYEVTYTAQGDIPRGAIGHIDVKDDTKSLESNYIDLGTCSANKCKYDVVTSPVKVLLKLTKTDGKVYQVSSSLDL